MSNSQLTVKVSDVSRLNDHSRLATRLGIVDHVKVDQFPYKRGKNPRQICMKVDTQSSDFNQGA